MPSGQLGRARHFGGTSPSQYCYIVNIINPESLVLRCHHMHWLLSQVQQQVVCQVHGVRRACCSSLCDNAWHIVWVVMTQFCIVPGISPTKSELGASPRAHLALKTATSVHVGAEPAAVWACSTPNGFGLADVEPHCCLSRPRTKGPADATGDGEEQQLMQSETGNQDREDLVHTAQKSPVRVHFS